MATAAEAKANNIEKMGLELGEYYSELWQDIAYLHMKWSEYVTLFGTKPSRVQMLNRAAPAFFGMVERELWGNILLHLARLTDPSETFGRKNLTLRGFPTLIPDATLIVKLDELLIEAGQRTAFSRDWRNRTLAHRDLNLALDRPSKALENGSRRDVGAALDAVVKVLNAVSIHYLESENHFRITSWIGGASALLYVVDDGLAEAVKREERRQSRNFLPEDLEDLDI